VDTLGNSGILGKDLFDLDRPYTHTKVQFGNDLYWIESSPLPLPYGATLTVLLNYDASDYLRNIEKLKESIAEKDRQSTLVNFLGVIKGFMHLPFYRMYVRDYGSLEPAILSTLLSAPNELCLADDVIADDGTILNKYFWAAEDIRMIQERYTWFLDKLFEKQEPEKKKGQRKLPLAAACRKSGLPGFCQTGR